MLSNYPPGVSESDEHFNPADDVPERPTLKEESARLLDYWERHGNNPEAVAKWAITDMLGILRFIVEDDES
jgi:hypothetical protein